MRPINSLKNVFFNSLYRASLISTFFAVLIIILLIFLSIEKDLRQEGQYLSQLVFKELRGAMNSGASYEEMNTLIKELSQSAPDIDYTMYRSNAIQTQFGEGRALKEDLIERIGDDSDTTYIESLDSIHYFKKIQFQQTCLECHQNVQVGDTAGVLDVTFPADRVRIPLYEVLLGLFLVFTITIFTSYLALSSDLMAHMINPLRRLEHKLKETQGHHDLIEPLKLDSELKEILSIELSFNAQQDLLRSAFKRVEEVSIYDQLTNTHNRHQLDRLFGEETLRSKRQGHPISVAMIDLNGFKKINDTYGHHAGDAILVHFSKLLIEHLRLTDKVIRYGGDEFLVLLPDCSAEQAKNLFKRIEEITHAEPYIYKGQPLHVKFSTGVAEFPEETTSDKGLDLIERADERMYEEKIRKKSAR